MDTPSQPTSSAPSAPSDRLIGTDNYSNVFITFKTRDLIRCTEEFATRTIPSLLTERKTKTDISEDIAALLMSVFDIYGKANPSNPFDKALHAIIQSRLKKLCIHIDLSDFDLDSNLFYRLLENERVCSAPSQAESD